MDLRFSLDTTKFRAQMRVLAERDVKIASTWALNDAAKEVQDHIAQRMTVVFDRPTKFTQRAFGVISGARPHRLEVEVGERTQIGRRHFLKVQEHGGSRPRTGFEGRLAVLLGNTGFAAIPTSAARKDGFGNWSSGERNQVMSQLKSGRDVGYSLNETAGSRKRKRMNAKRYFVPKHGLPAGVYRRDKPKADPVMVLSFSKSPPAYHRRLGFEQEAETKFWDVLPHRLDRALAKMIAKRS